MEYRTIPTTLGRAKLEQAALLQVPLQLTLVEFGDGDGAEYLPTGLETALKRKVYEATPNMLADSAESETWVELHAVLPFDAGGWWLREFIVRDVDGHAIFIGNLPESFKPIGSTGAVKDIAFELVFDILSPDSVTLKVDPSKVLATRKFVEEHVASELAKLDHKQSASFATKSNIVLNGLAVQDGGDWSAPLVAGARVLVKNQAVAKDNGLYVAAAGGWVRTADADISAEVTPGMVVAVEQGATLADTRWQLVTDAPILLGTTALVFQDITKGYAPLASPIFTGGARAPTASQFDSTDLLATTEFVQRALGNLAGVVGITETGQTLLASDAGKRVGAASAASSFNLPLFASLPVGACYWIQAGSNDITMNVQPNDPLFVSGAYTGASFVIPAYSEVHLVRSLVDWRISGGSGSLKDLPMFGKSLSAIGYQKLPSGLVLQWGNSTQASSSGSASITFPLTFPNACRQVFVLDVNAGLAGVTSGGFLVSGHSWGKSSFTAEWYRVAGSTGGVSQFNWFAIGD